MTRQRRSIGSFWSPPAVYQQRAAGETRPFGRRSGRRRKRAVDATQGRHRSGPIAPDRPVPRRPIQMSVHGPGKLVQTCQAGTSRALVHQPAGEVTTEGLALLREVGGRPRDDLLAGSGRRRQGLQALLNGGRSGLELICGHDRAMMRRPPTGRWLGTDSARNHQQGETEQRCSCYPSWLVARVHDRAHAAARVPGSRKEPYESPPCLLPA